MHALIEGVTSLLKERRDATKRTGQQASSQEGLARSDEAEDFTQTERRMGRWRLVTQGECLELGLSVDLDASRVCFTKGVVR